MSAQITLESIDDGLTYLFYVSYDRYREKLYKVGLISIAKNIDQIPAINVIGSPPVDIIGYDVTMKLLRILDTVNLITRLYNKNMNFVWLYTENTAAIWNVIF